MPVLSDWELETVFGRGDEEPDAVKPVPEAFDRVPDDVPEENYDAPSEDEAGGRYIGWMQCGYRRCSGGGVEWRFGMNGVSRSVHGMRNPPAQARISLGDGGTQTCASGVPAGGGWSSGDARASLHGCAGMHPPPDRGTGLSAAGISLSSRLQEPVLDPGAGASWKRGGLHSVRGDIGTAPGGETEEYRIGARSGL